MSGAENRYSKCKAQMGEWRDMIRCHCRIGPVPGWPGGSGPLLWPTGISTNPRIRKKVVYMAPFKKTWWDTEEIKSPT